MTGPTVERVRKAIATTAKRFDDIATATQAAADAVAAPRDEGRNAPTSDAEKR